MSKSKGPTTAEVKATTKCSKCGALPGQPCLSVTPRVKLTGHVMSTLHEERWHTAKVAKAMK